MFLRLSARLRSGLLLLLGLLSPVNLLTAQDEVISREYSLQVTETSAATTAELVSREYSLQVESGGGTVPGGMAEVVSREFSIAIGSGEALGFRELVSREFDILVPNPESPPPVTGADSSFAVETSTDTFGAVILDFEDYPEAAVGDVVGYDVYVADAFFDDVSSMDPVTRLPAGTLRQTLSGLPGNRTKYFAVVAVDAIGNFDPVVHAVAAQTSVAELGEVASLSGTGTATTLSFSWDPPAAGTSFLAGYRIHFADNPPVDLAAGQTEYEVTGLTRATGYTFRLSTIDIFGTESPGATLDAATWLDPPTNLTLVFEEGQIVARWDAPEPQALVAGYRIYQSGSDFSDVGGLTPLASTAETRQLLGDPASVQGQWFAVTTVNALGDADPSVTAIQSTRQGQTIDFPAPSLGSSPIPLTATATSGLPVTFEVLPETTAQLVDQGGPALQILQGGPVEITATQAGDANWWPASDVTRNLRIPPVIQTFTTNGVELADGATIDQLDHLLRVTAADAEGIAGAEFFLRPAGGSFSSLGSDATPGDGLTTVLATDGLTSGTYDLRVVVEAPGGHSSERTHTVTIEPGPPAAPVLDFPDAGTTTELELTTVTGTAQRGSSVTILRDGVVVAGPIPVDGSGNFSAEVPLVPGANALVARATNAIGTGPDSSPLTLTLRSVLSLTLDPSAFGEGESATLTLQRNHDQGAAGVTLRTAVAGQLDLPGGVAFADGETQTSASIQAIDDTVAELDEAVIVTGTASGYTSGNVQATILDDDRPALTLTTNRSSVVEGAAAGELIATITRSPVTERPIVVVLGSSAPDSAFSNAEAIIASSRSSVDVVVETPDNDATDGDRSVFLTATTFDITTGEALSLSNELELLVTDDDGPSLTLLLARQALREGTQTTATLSRIGPTSEALEVTLSSSDTGEATVPPTVTLPAGIESMPFVVTALDDGVDDGNQPLRIDATAVGFSPAQIAATVTDLNLADLAVTELEPPSAPLTNETVQFDYRIENQGSLDVDVPISIRAYLSRDAILDPEDEEISSLSYEGGLPANGYFEGTLSFITSRDTGTYRILMQVDRENLIDEVLDTNNLGTSAPFDVSPAYTATVSTDVSVAASGTPVELSGQAVLTRGGPAAFRLVNIHVMVRGTTRILSALTDSVGAFSATFTPLPGEGGVYSIGASHPGVDTAEGQDGFSLLGFTAEPDSLEATPLVDGPEFTAVIELTNLIDFPLESISASGVGLPAGIDISGSEIGGGGVDPLGTAAVEYRVSASAGAPAEAEGFVRFSSPEGAVLDVPITVLARDAESRLVRDGSTLKRGMIPGGRRFLTFSVRNEGGVETGPLQVLTPSNFEWMGVVSERPLPSVPPGGEAAVTLELAPSADFPLGLYTGNLIVAGAHNQLSVPFSLRAVSNGIGDLVVRCENEFTYFATGNPPLAGVLVRVLDPFTKAELASGTSGPDGLVSFPDLNEGPYELHATEPNHATVRRTVEVGAGDPTEVSLFLQRNTVTYTWQVVPTKIPDRYRVVIETEFETNVPAPVVTVEPAYIDLTELPDDINQVEFTITNHGLIAANDVRLGFNSSANWRIEALTSRLGTLPAKSQYRVPVTITNLNGGRSGGCGPGGFLSWNYECGANDVGGSAGVTFAGDGASCGGILSGNTLGGVAGGGAAPTASGSAGACNPCSAAAIPDCLLGLALDPVSGCAYGTARFFQDCGGKEESDMGCLIDLLQAAGGCACGFGGGGSACGLANCAIDLIQCAAAANGNARSYAEIFQRFEDRARHVINLVELELVLLGDPAWRDLLETEEMGAFWPLYKSSTQGLAGIGRRIGTLEEASMLGSDIGQSHPQLVADLIARWNRTVDYWEAGYFRIDQVPEGLDTDFLDLTSIDEAVARVIAGYEAAEADGFENPGQAFLASLDEFFAFLTTGGGVCTRVRLQLEQEAVMTRDAFAATLALDNSGDQPLNSIEVDLRVLDLDGFEVTDRFGLVGPEVVGGDGSTLPAQSAGSWTWTLVPGQDAAPEGQEVYKIFGDLRYTLEGEQVIIPLLPEFITVYPNPNLRLKYFHQRDVYSDDPDTDPIEPAIPFSLGVMIENTGAGPARDLSIRSGEPEIIDNEKGLLIDFEVIANRVNGQNLSPSLTADFGTIDPGGIGVAEWLMTSSLQGLFLNYSAEFEHLDDFGGTRSSLIESVEIFETIRPVRALGSLDDGLPDFLVNGTTDILDLPDEIHLSDGTVEPVEVSLSATAGTPAQGSLSVSLTGTSLGAGWGYLRIPDPGGEGFRLVSCVRSDGLEIPIDTNVWTTDRTFIGLGLKPVEEDLLHLVDRDSTDSYTLTYALVEPPDTTPPTSSVASLAADSGGFIEVSWSGTDNKAIARYDLYVSIDGGPFELWLDHTAETSALYLGELGSTYAFHSIAIDAAGNREPAKSSAESSTSVTQENQAPVLDPAGPLAVDEGETLRYRFTATDPDGPDSALTYALETPNPGITIQPTTGILTWQTSEEDGGTSVEVTVTVTDGSPEPLSDVLSVQLDVIDANSPPTFEPLAGYAIDAGETLSVQLVASDADLPAQVLRYRFAGGQPAGMTLDPVGGLIEWTPGSEFEGQSFSVEIEAYDDQTPEGFATRTLQVEVLEDPGLPPEFAPFPALAWQTDGVHSISVSATDPEGSPVTITADLTGLAGWPALAAADGSGTATFSWGTWGVTPGTYEIPLTASTGRQSVTVHLTVEMTGRAAFANYTEWTASFDLEGTESGTEQVLNPPGIPNILVYAFGLDPRAGLAPGQPERRPAPTSDAEGLRLTLPSAGLGRPDVEYVVERTAGNLSTDWQVIATKTGQTEWNAQGVTVEETPLEGDLTEVRLVTGPLPNQGSVLFRVRVSLLPD